MLAGFSFRTSTRRSRTINRIIAISTRLLLASCLFLVILCAKQESETAIDPARAILRYRLKGDPPTLDVAHVTDTQSAAVVLKIFDGLVHFDPLTLKVVPAVADRWEISTDGLVYTFHLKPNVLFHNRRKVTAHDFKYSFERTLNPKTASERTWVLAPIKGAEAFSKNKAKRIEGVTVLDDSTLVLTLNRPFAPFLSQLCMEAANVLPKEAVENSEKDFSSNPVGCGPFVFESWKRGSEIVLKRFDQYYGHKPKYAGIQYKMLPNVEVAYQQYLAGDLDFLDQIPQGRKTSLKKKRPKELKIWPILSIYYFGFNQRTSPFAGNRYLRQAMCYAVNRKEICEVIFEGTASPAHSILPPGIPGHDPSRQVYQYNPAKARTLLVKAGYPGGKGLPEITLWYNQEERHKRVAQYLQALLADINVKIKLKELEWGTYLDALQKREPNFYRLGWTADLPDADNFLHGLLHSSGAEDGDNYAGFQNADFDALVDEARATTDPEKRKKLYSMADSIAMADAVWMMIAYSQDACLLKPEWKGFLPSKQGDFAVPLERLYRE